MDQKQQDQSQQGDQGQEDEGAVYHDIGQTGGSEEKEQTKDEAEEESNR